MTYQNYGEMDPENNYEDEEVKQENKRKQKKNDEVQKYHTGK